MKLIFATNNPNKVLEMRQVIGNRFEVVALREAGIHIDIPEPYDTLEANATEKSTVIHRLTSLSCFSEDTGLEITALNGEPGVKSARYAGNERDFDANVNKVLHQLEGKDNRRARFKTVISLILEEREHLFTGICEGTISKGKKGTNGFGYDSIFVPDGAEKTFAEMDVEGKNVFSHRKKAVTALISFLGSYVSPI